MCSSVNYLSVCLCSAEPKADSQRSTAPSFCALAITAGTRKEDFILVLLFCSVASVVPDSLRPHGL